MFLLGAVILVNVLSTVGSNERVNECLLCGDCRRFRRLKERIENNFEPEFKEVLPEITSLLQNDTIPESVKEKINKLLLATTRSKMSSDKEGVVEMGKALGSDVMKLLTALGSIMRCVP